MQRKREIKREKARNHYIYVRGIKLQNKTKEIMIGS